MGEAGACAAKEMKLVLNNGQLASWSFLSPTSSLKDLQKTVVLIFQNKKNACQPFSVFIFFNLDFDNKCSIFCSCFSTRK